MTDKDLVRRLDLLLHIWHALTTLTWERNRVLIDVKAGWAQQLVWMCLEMIKSVTAIQSLVCSAHTLVATPSMAPCK